MSAPRREPRRSQLAGVHPAVPPAPVSDTPQPGTAPLPTTEPFPATPARRSSSVGSHKLTVNLPPDVIGRAKDAFWLARDDYRTFSAWVEDALRRHVDHTKQVRSLEQIPVRPRGPLPTGRPVD
jgi:hypothetical protein